MPTTNSTDTPWNRKTYWKTYFFIFLVFVSFQLLIIVHIFYKKQRVHYLKLQKYSLFQLIVFVDDDDDDDNDDDGDVLFLWYG